MPPGGTYHKYIKGLKGGKMLTGELKQILVDKLDAFLRAHQKKREAAKKKVGKFLGK